MMSKLTLNKTKTRRCASAALDHPSVEQHVPRSGYTLLDSDVYGLLRSRYSSAPSVSCTGPAPGNTVTRCGAGPTWFGAPLDLFGADLADCSAGGAHGVTRAPARSPSVLTTGVVRHNKTKTKERVHAAVFAPKQTGAPTSILRGGRSAGCWTQVCRCTAGASRNRPAWTEKCKTKGRCAGPHKPHTRTHTRAPLTYTRMLRPPANGQRRRRWHAKARVVPAVDVPRVVGPPTH